MVPLHKNLPGVLSDLLSGQNPRRADRHKNPAGRRRNAGRWCDNADKPLPPLALALGCSAQPGSGRIDLSVRPDSKLWLLPWWVGGFARIHHDGVAAD